MKKTWNIVGAALLAGSVLVSGNAQARTQTFIGGAPENPAQNSCFFNDFNLGVGISSAAGCGTGWWDVGLVWDTSGTNRAIVITATTPTQISSCLARTHDSNGVQSSNVSFGPWTALGGGAGYSYATATVNVPLGGTTHIECHFTGPLARLLKVDYAF